MNFYYFDTEKLEYKRVDFKPLLILPVILAVSFLFRFLFFDAAIIETTDFRGKKCKVTIEQHLEQKKIERKYEQEYKNYLKNAK